MSKKEKDRERELGLTGSTSQETSEPQMHTETLGIKCKHSHTQYRTLN